MTPVEREAAQYRREARFNLSHSLGLALALLGFVIGAKTMTDNSLLTHVATGREVIDRGSVPTVDLYSSTAAGQPWTVQSWLASLIYGTVDRLGGPWAIRTVHGLVSAAIGVGLWQLTRPAVQIVPRLVLAILPLVLGLYLWSPRPLMFGLLAMVAVLQVLQLDRPAWVLVPVMWLWVNAHGSFPMAVALLAAAAVGAWIDERTTPRRELRFLTYALGGIALGAVNPLGPRLLWFPFHLLGRSQALDRVVEWQAPSFDNYWEWLFLALMPLIVLAAKRGARWQSILPAIGFLVGGLFAVRNMAIASVVIVAMVAPTLQQFYGAEDGSTVSMWSRLLGKASIAGMAVAAIAVVVQPALRLELYPIDEIDYLEARGLVATAEVNLIHREAVGNYLTFRYGDQASVFIDDRFDFYPLDVTADHLTLLYGGDYAEVLDRRAADVVLWAADSLLGDHLEAAEDWSIARRSDAWIIACRRDSPVFDRCRPEP